MRLLLRLVAAAACSVPLVLVAPVVPASSAACTDCRGPVLASGQVTLHGRPRPTAVVELRAWPTVAELAAQPRGSLVDRPVVASAVTGIDGRYAVRLDPSSVSRFRSETGSVDLQLVATYDGRSASVPFSATIDGKGPAPRWVTTGSPDESGHLDLELGGSSVVTERHAPTTDSVGEGDGADLCGHVELGRWFYDNREKFMNVHNWPGAKATVEQAVEDSSEHELGIAIKLPGKIWQPSHTVSLTQSESAGSGVRVSGLVNKAVYNSVNYREVIYKTWIGHEECYRERRPMSFYNLLDEPSTDITHVNFRKGCTIRRQGELWKDSERNQTFKRGVDLGVVSVSAQSGYSEGTRVGFTIKRPTRICTNNSEGWLQATRFDLRSARTSPAGAV